MVHLQPSYLDVDAGGKGGRHWAKDNRARTLWQLALLRYRTAAPLVPHRFRECRFEEVLENHDVLDNEDVLENHAATRRGSVLAGTASLGSRCCKPKVSRTA